METGKVAIVKLERTERDGTHVDALLVEVALGNETITFDSKTQPLSAAVREQAARLIELVQGETKT